MVAGGLIIAGEVTGFISFIVTMLTLLGVYRDLLSSLRSADVRIPIILANLRQEIIFEKAFIAERIKHGDEFHVFRRRLSYAKQSNGPKERSRRDFSLLLEATIKELWIEFKNLERPFLIENSRRAEEVRKGDYWDEKDLEQQKSKSKPRRNGKGNRKNVEEQIRETGSMYYRTDLAHRWIWWQTQGAIQRLADQVQRVQIRRMERDLYETDELVKRLVRKDGGASEIGSGSGSSSGSDGGWRRRSVAGVGVVKSRNGSRAPSKAGSGRSVRMPSRRGSMAGRTVREVEEREIIRRHAASPHPTRQSDMEASNTGRRRERRAEPRSDFEVLRPGSVYVEVADRPRRSSGYGEDKRGTDRIRSYSRERGR